MLIDCRCGQTNRVPGASAKRMRCGKCGHVFTPQELTKARVEPAPPPPAGLQFDTDATHACNDDEDCGWEGTEDELENKRCPDCGKRVHELE
jgi:ribosomal protein S27AE